jgi:hypothetical protein
LLLLLPYEKTGAENSLIFEKKIKSVKRKEVENHKMMKNNSVRQFRNIIFF